jgi:dTDP-4-amino-4,6-dideoxygalactose transaminase
MQIAQAPRASAILYHLLSGRGEVRPWLLPANICPIVPITFFKARVPFEFVDVSVETLHMDLEQVEVEVRRRRVGGILYAHTYGEPSTPESFFCHVKELDETVMLVDDRCLCVPTLEPVSARWADVELNSTGYAKIADLGMGGYAFLKDDVPYHQRSLLYSDSAHAAVEQAYKQAVGARQVFHYHDSDWLQTEAELPGWQAYRTQIEAELEQTLPRRAAINAVYARLLPKVVQLPEAYQTWRFNLRVPAPQPIVQALFAEGLFASTHYASLAGIMAPGRCEQAERLQAEVLNLFNDRHFDEAQAEQACAVILRNL